MRPHGRANISPTNPSALGICDFCSFTYNHKDLSWQMDWRGPNIQNLRFLVCDSCRDKPQQSGQRTIILPPDPIPIANARPQQFLVTDNPMSPIGLTQTSDEGASGFFGTMTGGGGVVAAFNGTINKPAFQCAYSVATTSYHGYVAKNWSPYAGGITEPSSLVAPVITHSLSSFSAYAPNDQSFVSSGPTDWLVQGSPNSVSWTTISSGTTAGTAGETISDTLTGSPYQFHRLAFLGDGVTAIYVAQVKFSVAQV
jgi:hypothetical protein